jgi:hypothetical protein
MSVQNSLISNVTYPPATVNVTVTAAIPVNDSTISVSPYLTTNKIEFISLLPVSGKHLSLLSAQLPPENLKAGCTLKVCR